MRRLSLSVLILALSAVLCPLAAQMPGAVAPHRGLGSLVSGWGGLQMALAPGGLSAPTAGGTGYAIGNAITLSCAGVTFATAPVVVVTAVSGGAVTGATVATGGTTTGAVPGGSLVCSQQSVSPAGGAGYAATATFGLVAATISVPALGTAGGPNNGSFFLTAESGNLAEYESTMVGDRAGAAFGAGAAADTAFGHNACGNSGGAGGTSTGSYDLCVGRNAGRNLSGSAEQDTFIGDAAGGNEAGNPITGNQDTIVGAGAGATIGGGNYISILGVGSAEAIGTASTVIGAYSAKAATGYDLTVVGAGVAATALTSAHDSVLIGPGSLSDTCDSNLSDAITLCGAGGPIWSATGTQTPSTAATTLAGTLSLPNIATSGTIGGAVCMTSAGLLLYESGASGCTVSLRALKRGIAALGGGAALADLLALRPVEYRWREGDGRTHLGFIAENAKAADPRFAAFDGNGRLQGYDPNAILAATVAVVRRQQYEIWALTGVVVLLALATGLLWRRELRRR